jgi:hypothetical protein
MADKVGVFNRLGWATSGTTASAEFEFLEGSSLGLAENFIDTNALRGTRSHGSERVRRGLRQVNGTLLFAPNPLELVTLLPLILGGSPSGTSYPLAETLPTSEWFASRDGTIYHVNGAVVESATFSAQEGGPMTVSMTVVGKDEVAEGSMGSAAIDVTTQPFTLMDAAVSVASGAREVSGFELTIRNTLEVKYRNSLTPTQIVATDREVTLSLPISLGTDSALYGSALGGVAATVTLTNGTVSLAFSLAKVQAPREELPFGQRGILDFPWRGVARKSGSTLELVTTLDSTV